MAKASELIKLAQSWVGKKESDGSFKSIIDIYNAHKPLARGYKVKYTDHWCATFISALAIQCNATNIIPTECGCGQMIALFQKLGCWVEDDSYVPSVGSILFYDWGDSGKGDCTGWSDHVGIVEKVSGNTITVIEGNYNEAVKRRNITVNARYIRGYGVPKYDVEKVDASKTETTTTTPTPTTKSVSATESAKSFANGVAGTYKSTANLNVRFGAGTTKKVMTTIPKGTQVKNYGYYTMVSNTKWLYIQFTLNGVKYTGYSSSKYLSKV